MDLLAIDSAAEYNDVISGMEYHSHRPYASSTYNNNDEIRIPINQNDVITAPFESQIHIKGKVSGTKATGEPATVALVNNAVAFLFDDIRYEIAASEVDRTRNVGITSTLKNLLSLRKSEKNKLGNAGWLGAGETKNVSTDFTLCVPLKMFMGFFEDYRRIVVNVKQELILLRSSSDLNAIYSDDATEIKLEITSIHWRVPHLTVTDAYKLKILKMIERDSPVHVPFRSWEVYEFPTLPQTKQLSWTVKTANQLEKPRYVILAFQTDRKNQIKKDAALFDKCNITNVKLYLNSLYFPYDNLHGDVSTMYDMYTRFQQSYYMRDSSPTLNLDKFTNKAPIFVIDCSKQNDSIKSGPVDVRLEIEASVNIPANTTAYCLILHDSHIVYNLLSGTVKKLVD